MLHLLLTSVRTTGVLFILTGLLYPLALTTLAQAIFPEQASGSLIKNEQGRVVGSVLIGQQFTQAGYFHSRPSAVASRNALASSGGSNLGPTSRALRSRVMSSIQTLRAENPAASRPVPAELVTTSASGLDPHLSPAGALWQVERVAQVRGVEPVRIQALVEANIEDRTLGILGEPRVNVLKLNLALDRQLGLPAQAPFSP